HAAASRHVRALGAEARRLAGRAVIGAAPGQVGKTPAHEQLSRATRVGHHYAAAATPPTSTAGRGVLGGKRKRKQERGGNNPFHRQSSRGWRNRRESIALPVILASAAPPCHPRERSEQRIYYHNPEANRRGMRVDPLLAFGSRG